MLRPAKRRFLSLGFTVLALMILYVACSGLHADAAEEKAVHRELTHEGWSGCASETYLLSAGGGQGIRPCFTSVKEAGNNSSAEPSGEMAGVPGVVFQSWRGFALKGNESYSIRVSIESLRSVEVMSIRKLMASNLTLEEIKNEIRKDEGGVIHRGVLRIGSDIYRLDNISMAPKGNKTVLDADVYLQKFGSAQNKTTTTTGHLNVPLSRKDGMVVSQGILLMKSGKYLGDYRVLLDGQHWDGEMMSGRARSAIPKRDMKAEQGHPFGPPDLS
ncbi:Uncharacterised protein [uncultured archaeon]|nr:Uncharacterised protein [uncultured archaeon]